MLKRRKPLIYYFLIDSYQNIIFRLKFIVNYIICIIYYITYKVDFKGVSNH